MRFWSAALVVALAAGGPASAAAGPLAALLGKIKVGSITPVTFYNRIPANESIAFASLSPRAR